MKVRARLPILLVAFALASAAGAGCGDEASDAEALGGGGQAGAASVAATSSASATTASSATATATSDGDGGAAGGNPRAPLGLVFEQTPSDAEAVAAPLSSLPEGSIHLDGESFIVRTCTAPSCLDGGSALAFLATADMDGDFLIEPVVDATAGPDPAAEVNAYHHLEAFLERFRELGFEGLDEPAHIILDAQLDFDGDGEPDDFFAGATDLFGRPGIVMGTVDDRNLAYDPDVFGHEFTHIVTGVAGALALDTSLDPTGPSVAAGAMREGTADFYAASFMDDPEIGEYSTEPLGIPYFSSVANDATCPRYLVGEAHADGQIWSGTLWELRAVVGADRLEQALFDVLRQLPLGATLPDAFGALRERLAPELDAVELDDLDATLQARGVADCLGIAPLDPGTAALLYVLAPGEEIWDPDHEETLSFDEMPAALQFRIDVPEGLATLTLELVAEDDSPVAADLARIHVRVGAPVVHTHDGTVASVIDDGSDVGTFVLDAASTPPLVAGALFVSITYGGEEPGYARLQARQ